MPSLLMLMYSGITIEGSGTNMQAITSTKTRPRARYLIFANANPAAVLMVKMISTAAQDTSSELSNSRRIGWLLNSRRQLASENPVPSWYWAWVLNELTSM